MEKESDNFASLGPLLLARKGAAKPAMVPDLGTFDQDDDGQPQLADTSVAGPVLDEANAFEDADPIEGSGPIEAPAEIAQDSETSRPSLFSKIARIAERRTEPEDAGLAGDAEAQVPSGTDLSETNDAASGPSEVHRQREELAQRLVSADLAQTKLPHDEEAAAPDLSEASPLSMASQFSAPKQRKPRSKPKLSGRRAAFTLRLDADRHLKLRLASTVAGTSAQQLVTQALDRFLEEMPEIEPLIESLAARSPSEKS